MNINRRNSVFTLAQCLSPGVSLTAAGGPHTSAKFEGPKATPAP